MTTVSTADALLKAIAEVLLNDRTSNHFPYAVDIMEGLYKQFIEEHEHADTIQRRTPADDGRSDH